MFKYRKKCFNTNYITNKSIFKRIIYQIIEWIEYISYFLYFKNKKYSYKSRIFCNIYIYIYIYIFISCFQDYFKNF